MDSCTATARDSAGNTATTSGRSHVNRYRFSGFPQPINDPRIQPGAPVSVVKAGSTLPVKFQLRDMGGNLVQGRGARSSTSTTGRQKGFAASYSYQIGVRLDDGHTFYVTVGLK